MRIHRARRRRARRRAWNNFCARAGARCARRQNRWQSPTRSKRATPVRRTALASPAAAPLRSRLVLMKLLPTLPLLAVALASAASAPNPRARSTSPIPARLRSMSISPTLRGRSSACTRSFPRNRARWSSTIRKWIPGEHVVRARHARHGVTGVVVTASGELTVATWQRDLTDMYSLKPANVPRTPGTRRLIELDFQFSRPRAAAEFGASPSVHAEAALCIEWNQVAFYPAGYFVEARILSPSRARRRCLAGWGFATAARAVPSESGGKGEVQAARLRKLLSIRRSIAGKNFKRIDLVAPKASRRPRIFPEPRRQIAH